MVLIVTNSSDPTADFFVANLRANRQPYFRFDTDKFLTSYRVQYSHSGGRSCFSLTNTNTSEKVLSDDVSGIWYRRPVDPQLNIDDAKDELGRQLSQEARCEYEWILRSLDGVKWVSRPERLRFAEDRLVQLRIAADVGFSVPDTIITNSESEARQFLSLHPRVCNKPLLIGQMEIGEDLYLYYNSMVSEKDDDFLGKVANFPILLQEFVDKEDELRITVVGDSAFPVRVLSESGSEAAIDWRVENGTQVQYKQTSISPHLTRLVMNVMRRLDLEFAAIDIVVSKTGQCYLLDLNPNGQWAWLDQLLDLGIADQLRSVLSGGD